MGQAQIYTDYSNGTKKVSRKDAPIPNTQYPIPSIPAEDGIFNQ